jgi:PAS domain S-box-containing protein
VTTLQDLSWKELVDQLGALERSAGAGGSESQAARLVHELHVHQVELEIQNRELREAQQRLETSQARYAELYDRAPVGYATLDANGLIVEINLTAAALLGRERNHLVKTPFAAIGLQNPKAFLSHLLECAKNQGTTAGDVQVNTAKGKVVLQLMTTPYSSAIDHFVGFRMTMSDVTERRHAEAQEALLESERRAREEADAENRMKDQFLGIVSHELRTPLNTIIGWTQILNTRANEPDLVARGLQIMQRNGLALARIVDDIMDVSRIVSGKLNVVTKKTAADEIVQGALDQARPAARARGIAIRESIERGCVVLGDALRLEQVVSNLLSNAIKFTSDGGHVDVTLEQREGRVCLDVRDDGCGIDAADLPHVFEHFRQADSSTTRAHEGLGLGLAIARHIVLAHGGTIEARSEGRGRGAAFIVTLPSRRFTTPPPPVRPGSVDKSTLPRSVEGAKVLYVDDEPDAVELVGLMLGELGAVVRTATCVDDAITLASSFAPDVVVSDIAMPGRDGFDLIRSLRTMGPPLSEVPAIALTAYARPEDGNRALRAGFKRHLAKPVEIQVLAEAILTLVPPA